MQPVPAMRYWFNYAEQFNARNFDQLRDMLAAEVRLELVSRAEMNGRKEVGNYLDTHLKDDAA